MNDRSLAPSACGLAVLIVLLSACAPPSALPPQPAALCDLKVDGRWITGPAGKPVILFGANLPTLTAMEASNYKAEARLRDLAGAGARVVRLAVDVQELTPTFVPAKVAPFAQAANQQGMLVVLSWNVVIGNPVNDGVDDAEDWIRLVILYLSNDPGVWFDLYNGVQMQDVPPARQRNIAQRLIDVTRGYRANNVIVINDPAWLLDSDPAINQPLDGGNIVYGLDARAGALPALKTAADTGAGYDLARFPFIVTRWGGAATAQQMGDIQALQIGAIASSDEAAAAERFGALSAFWQANQADWAACEATPAPQK